MGAPVCVIVENPQRTVIFWNLSHAEPFRLDWLREGLFLWDSILVWPYPSSLPYVQRPGYKAVSGRYRMDEGKDLEVGNPLEQMTG
jgi:hypothetical protein